MAMRGERKAVSRTCRLAGPMLAAALLVGPWPARAHEDGAKLLIVDSPERVTVVRRIGGVTVVDSRRRAVPRLDGRVRVWEIGERVRLHELPEGRPPGRRDPRR